MLHTKSHSQSVIAIQNHEKVDNQEQDWVLIAMVKKEASKHAQICALQIPWK